MHRPEAETKFLRLKWRRDFDRWRGKAALLVIAAKGGFDPNQPRVPAGKPNGGQWSGGGSGSGGRTSLAAAAGGASPKNPKDPKTQFRPKKRRPSPVKKLDVPVNKTPAKRKGPLSPTPDIPKQTPSTKKLETRVAKELGKWLLKAAARRALGPIGIALDVIDGAIWLHQHYPDIQSYFDDAQPLNVLQRSVNDPVEGYEIHHIVERAVVKKDGIGHNRVNSPENLVRIPKWKHHEITGWYATKNKRYGGQTPREYLQGRSWDEKFEVGLRALRKYEVLK